MLLCKNERELWENYLGSGMGHNHCRVCTNVCTELNFISY